MKEKGGHEGCIEQIYRLFHDELLYSSVAPVWMLKGDLSVDDKELRPDVQEAVAALWSVVNTENLYQLTDFPGL
jgi:enoyl-[acyl-carrier protein] reductase/trans-2-enoyl-CoA reductase (NAD+)